MQVYTHKAQYYETDQMGIIHHSNYIRWFEEARVDWLEQLGMGYDRLEKEGVTIPVVSVCCEYRQMVRFGEVVFIHLAVKSIKNARLSIGYTITNEDGSIVYTTGETGHCFLGTTGRPVALKKAHPALYELFLRHMEAPTA